jgi:glycosyltransferase involved in cell wall biosynthesis
VRLLSILIPVYNELPTVEELLSRVRAAELPAGLERQIVMVDDGSTDRTGRIAEAAGANLLRHPVNRGKGAALSTGFEGIFAAGYDRVITIDADGQHLPEEAPSFLAAAEGGAEMILGCRARLFPAMAPVRRTSNRLSSFMIATVAGLPLADVQCGYRLYTRGLIEKVGFPETGFEAESAVIVRAARAGARIETIPIDLGFVDGRPTSHYRPVLDSMRIAAGVTRSRLDMVQWTHPRS